MAGWVGEWNGWGLCGVVRCLSSGVGVAAGGVRRLPALPLRAGRRAQAWATGPGRDALSLSIVRFRHRRAPSEIQI